MVLFILADFVVDNVSLPQRHKRAGQITVRSSAADWFPAQILSNEENVFILWRNHMCFMTCLKVTKYPMPTTQRPLFNEQGANTSD